MKLQPRPLLFLGTSIAGMMLLTGCSVSSLGDTEYSFIGGISVLIIAVLAIALTRGKQRKNGDEPQTAGESEEKTINDDSASNDVIEEKPNSSVVALGKFEIRDKFVNYRFDPELGAAYAEYFGYLPYDEYLRILENSYKLVQYHHATKCLINIQQLVVHDPRGAKYINDVWTPTVKKLGVRYVALVLPASAVGQASSEKAHQSIEVMPGLFMKNFSDEGEARKWLSGITI